MVYQLKFHANKVISDIMLHRIDLVSVFSSINGELKTQAVWAKKARGLFTRFLITQYPTSIKETCSFNKSGFSFDSYNKESGEILFIRKI